MDIVIKMMNEKSGLWNITRERVVLIQQSLSKLSRRSRDSAKEMLDVAAAGNRFWTTKAEYYAALAEIKADASSVSSKSIDETIAHIVRGSKIDGVDDRPWVKQALEVLTRISREK
jgi:hypothetical protein